MILYGRNLSPYARRVAIWLTLQGREFERGTLSAFDDFDRFRALNPVVRAPVLELEDGTRLIESWAICDFLESTAPPGRALVPALGPARLRVMQEIALATATTDKIVALAYETRRRAEALRCPDWIARLESQIAGGLEAMEARAPEAGWLGGERPNGADIAFVCAHDMGRLMAPHLAGAAQPKLSALAARAAALPAFAETAPG